MGVKYFMEQLQSYQEKTGLIPNGVVLQDWLYYKIKDELSSSYYIPKESEVELLCGIEVHHGMGMQVVYFY